MQWRNEIEAHTEGSTVAIWHGASREANLNELKKYHFVCFLLIIVRSNIELSFRYLLRMLFWRVLSVNKRMVSSAEGRLLKRDQLYIRSNGTVSW